MEFDVVISGPDEHGMYSATVGKYIRYKATHMDDQIRADLISVANERANLVMEVPDDKMTCGYGEDLTPVSIVKADLATCIKTPAAGCGGT